MGGGWFGMRRGHTLSDRNMAFILFVYGWDISNIWHIYLLLYDWKSPNASVRYDLDLEEEWWYQNCLHFKIFTIQVKRKNVAWTNITMTVGICYRCSLEPIFKISSKSGQLELRYSWYGQMSQWQMLRGQMTPWQLESVLNVHRNLPLKFYQNRFS